MTPWTETGAKLVKICIAQSIITAALLLSATSGSFAFADAMSIADAHISAVLSETELQAQGTGTCPVRGERYRVEGRETKAILGYTEVLRSNCATLDTWQATLGFIAHEGQGLIRPGDRLLILEKGAEAFPGRTDLLMSGPGRKGRHKPLTYLGITGETAETLDKHEVLLDIASRVFYGVSDDVTLSTVLVAAVAYPNVGLKYRVWSRPWSTLSLGTSLVGTGYAAEEGLHLYSAGLSFYYDVKSNTKSISHTVITLASPPDLYRQVTRPGDVLASLTSSIRTGSQHIFDNWDRLLYGPQYMFETRTVGGYIAYVFVWDHLNVSLNLNVYDVTKLKFGVDGYVPHVFAFWRF